MPGASADTIKFNILAVVGNSMCEDVNMDYALLSVAGTNEIEMTSFCINENAMGAEFMVKGTEDVVVEMMTSNSSGYGFLLEYEASKLCC